MTEDLDIYALFGKGRVPAGQAAPAVSAATPYGARALEAEADRVATAAEGTRNDTLNRAAFALGQLVAGGELPEALAREQLTTAATRAGLGAWEAARTITSGISAGMSKPRTAPGSPVPGTDREPGTTTVPGSGPPMWEPGTAAKLSPYADIAALLAGAVPEPPEPDTLTRSDGRALFYSGQVNLLYGDPESGKTFVALAAAAEHLNDGGRVLILDLDHNGPQATVQRLLMLGARPEALADLERFRYVEPEDREHLLVAVTDSRQWHPGVAVIDSIGELLPLFGASSNSPDDFTAVHTAVMKPLAMAGAAVICIDHLAKNAESRSYGATGTAAKRRAIGGVSIRVVIADAFTPGRGGACHLTINKDRHGGLRQHCPTGDKEPLAGTFTLSTDSRTGTTAWAVRAPSDGDRNPSEMAASEDVEAVAALDPPPATVEEARTRLGWRKQRAALAVREWRKRPEPTTVPGSRHIGGNREPAGCEQHPGGLTDDNGQCVTCRLLEQADAAGVGQ